MLHQAYKNKHRTSHKQLKTTDLCKQSK